VADEFIHNCLLHLLVVACLGGEGGGGRVSAVTALGTIPAVPHQHVRALAAAAAQHDAATKLALEATSDHVSSSNPLEPAPVSLPAPMPVSLPLQLPEDVFPLTQPIQVYFVFHFLVCVPLTASGAVFTILCSSGFLAVLQNTVPVGLDR
jgi:hypothetical protein